MFRAIYFFFFLASLLAFWIHTLLGMITDTPLYSISSRMIWHNSSWFFGTGSNTRMCSGSTPIPRQIASRCPNAEDSCPPVMEIDSLSEMMIVIVDFSFTASSNPVIPECVKVESPITDTAGNNPASAAPLAIVIEAPMSTQELIAWNGGKAPKV